MTALLVGHTDTVNAVKFLHTSLGLLIISGSVDTSVRIWLSRHSSQVSHGVPPEFQCIQVLGEHTHSINSIATTTDVDIFATASADATVKIWKINTSAKEGVTIKLQQSIQVAPRFFPLALALSPLHGAPGSFILAAAGTATFIQLYIVDFKGAGSLEFKLQATLKGHEGWVRSLAFTRENANIESDLLLSSASQDKYIRLWRIHQGNELPAAAAAGSDPGLGAFLPGKSLSNKAHRFAAGEKDYSATFEALLLGHEDWIYSTAWRATGDTLQLLSASADNSLAIWEQDKSSGIWVTIARLGEISAQKGSTTATGSTGGFWTGLWSPSGKTVTCLGRTGSWRVWNYDDMQDRWIQIIGISGHTDAVTGICWSKRGDYLLSTGSDRTTRLHAKWIRNGHATWHEMARPQIHGYDLNCIDSLGESRFVSGADEKVIRVFNEPKAVADLLQKLSGISSIGAEDMPDAANMPVLGLSNKAIEAVSSSMDDLAISESKEVDPASVAHKSTLELDHPPLEDHLSRHTLWPEIEKLYGHGYEISALAASHDASIIATACKASAIDHAVIRLFGAKDWKEIKPPLTAHSLTVTRLRFSRDDKLLLSVGRDRQWAVSEKGDKDGQYTIAEANPKGHSRMILDAAWLPGERRAFATAGRDKQVKIWEQVGETGEGTKGGFVCRTTIPEESPVTAIDFMDTPLDDGLACLAVGTEAGRLSLYCIDLKDLGMSKKFVVEARLVFNDGPQASRWELIVSSSGPSMAITQLAWRPSITSGEDVKEKANGLRDQDPQLAVASEDFSLRIFSLKVLLASRVNAGVC